MTPFRKATIVLSSLDKSVTSEMFSHLPRETVERLTLELARMDNVTQDERNVAITEFRDALDSRTEGACGTLDQTGELVAGSSDEDAATGIVNNESPPTEPIPFAFLHQVNADDLLNVISDEHSQTVALILSWLSTELAADILAKLPPARQLDVVQRIAGMQQTTSEIVREVEANLKSRMASLFHQETGLAGGVPLVAQILNVTDRVTSQGILAGLERESTDLGEEIQRLMFVFDDLVKLDDRAIQLLLRDVDNSQWAMALKGASAEIRDKVLSNLSERAAENLKEEMEYLGPVRLSDVEAVQQHIVDASATPGRVGVRSR